ncbi:MAG: protein-tyrosine phosphatase family protein [Rubrivivax sp.]
MDTLMPVTTDPSLHPNHPYSPTALASPGDALPRPHQNCYWLVPGVLLAGEYPRTPDEAPSRAKLRATLQAGVRHFVDLTEPDERLEPYDVLLREEAAALGVGASHERHAIRDMQLPADRAALHALLRRRRAPREGATYVHCWGGIGRTGTVIGCLLVDLGLDGPQALALIARKWQVMEKRERQPHSPQTAAQMAYVMNWARPGRSGGHHPN